jgi:protein involved in polysaccharide export with SLBB domain
MGEILISFERLLPSFRRHAVALALSLLLAGILAPAQSQQQQQPPAAQAQQPQDTDLPAEEIIQALQDDPQLLAEAKSQIVNELRNRGYSVSEREITDDRLFGQIRADDRVRHLMSDELKRRGYGASDEENPTAAKPAQPAAGANQPREAAPSADKNKAMKEMPAVKVQRAQQSQYPLRNLPAMHDLYTQALNPQITLERFGTALFRNSVANAERGGEKSTSDIPVGPDYVIGAGDELVVEYWGNTTQRLNVTVNREGRILIPEAGAVAVAGRSLGDARSEVERALRRQFKNISVDVSLGKLRSVRAYVVGDVKNPGAYDISSLSTPLSALIAAGGPTETGSYRLVKHFRGQKLEETVDLYDLMLKGVTTVQVHIESGDSILVPPVGPQVTIAGAVRRPAIYELNNEQTLDQALALAGGVPVTGSLNKITVERIEAHERKEMLSVNLPQSGDTAAAMDAFKRVQIKDGDVITVSPILASSNEAVYLQGHVFRPGKYPFRAGEKVTDLIASYSDLLPEPADRGEIVRLQPPDMNPLVISFNVRDVLEKKTPAPALQPFDTVRVFGRYETDAPKVSIYGEVLRAGEYPLSDRMTAADLLRLAGGFKRGAYRESADLGSYSVINGERVELDHRIVAIGRALAGEPDTDVLLKPGDVLTIGQIGGWNDIGGAIGVSGEVTHPGHYTIQRGERLSSIIRRAGGFSADAYPYGAILERAQVREFAAKNREEMIAKVQEQANPTGSRLSSPTSRQSQQLIERLRQIQPSGRMLIHVTRDVQKWQNTFVDVEVRPGDTLYIPKRPNFVMVAGQVYNPAAVTYSAGKHAAWYLRQAGGPTSLANKKDIYVIRANGTVVGKGSGEWWSGNVTSAVLQPGDTVFVPDKASGGNAIFKNLSQTISLLSGAAVAVSVIRTF